MLDLSGCSGGMQKYLAVSYLENENSVCITELPRLRWIWLDWGFFNGGRGKEARIRISIQCSEMSSYVQIEAASI